MRWLPQSPRRAHVAVLLLVLATGTPLGIQLLGAEILGGAQLGSDLMDTPVVALAAAGAGYLGGAWLRPPVAGLCSLAGAATLTAANQLAHPGEYSVPNDLFFYVVLLGGTSLAGALVTARRHQVRELRRLSEIRHEQRRAEIRGAALEERNRVAGGTAHSLSQRLSGLLPEVSGARRERRPEAVRVILGRIEQSGRAGLEELRTVLGSLREPSSAERVRETAAEPTVEVRRPASRHSATLDWTDVLAGASGVPLAFESVASTAAHGPPWANVLAGVAVGCPLVLRRRWPLTATATMLGVAALMSITLTPLPLTVSSLVPLSLAAYSIGDRTRGWRRLAGTGLLGLGLAAIVLASPPGSRDPGGIPPTAVWLGLTVLAGALAAQHASRARDLDALVRAIEAGRHHALHLAVTEQRQAIARDLHDSVAHAMTVVCLHAEAAQQHWLDLETVAEALTTIEDTVRRAIRELRHGLEELDPAGADTPDLTTRDVETALAALADGIGIFHEVSVSGECRLHPGVVAVVTRVAREALVNIARHAPGSHARILVVGGPTELLVEVTNRVVDVARDRDDSEGREYLMGTGTGLLGLTELVRANAGRLEYGVVADRFRVAAYLPTTARVSA